MHRSPRRCLKDSRLVSPLLWCRYHLADFALHSLAQAFTSLQNTLTLDNPPPSGWPSFSPPFHLSLAEVCQQRVQVPSVGGGIQGALSHHAESHAQGGPDVVWHHGGCSDPRPPGWPRTIHNGLALQRQSFQEVLYCLSEKLPEGEIYYINI